MPPHFRLWHGGSGACTAASQQEGHGFDSCMGHCWLGGQVLPRPSVFRWARYLCVEFACSPSVHKNPNSTLSYQSLTKMDGSLHLVPGRLKAALGSWRKDNPGWGNAEVKFTAIVDITRLYTNENHLGTPYSSQLSWKYKELFSWC